MAVVTIGELNTAIATTLGAAAGIARVQDAAVPGESGGLTEGMSDLPTMQVYWQSSETDDGGTTDRTVFGAMMRQTRLEFRADVYVRPRGNLSEDFAAVLAITEAVTTVLEAQTDVLFALQSIQAFHWRSQRVTFDYAGTAYAGVQFTLTLWVY